MSTLKFLAIALLLLAMVWPAAPPAIGPGLAGSEWRVVEIGGNRASGAGTVRFTQTSVRGKAPCNSYFGAFRESGSSIEIAGINETRMMCAGRMELERDFLDGLSRARSYLLDRGMLMLLDGSGQALVKLTD